MAHIPKFTDDLAFIQKLGDNPNTDNGLTASELKARFDAAPLAIQNYINEIPLPALNNSLTADGGKMQGPIDMGGYKVTGLGTPTADGDAVPKGYLTPDNVGAAPSEHDHKYAGSSTAGGAATSAEKLATKRTIQVNLASDGAASFDGSANVSPGVTGTLPIENGGTGNATGNAATATKLEKARTIRTNLASTSAASFDGSENATPGVTGTLPVKNGGIGSSNGATGLKNLLAAGNTILSSYQYGDTLPAAGNKGRIFFKKVSN